jgi:hypothetical protein
MLCVREPDKRIKAAKAFSSLLPTPALLSASSISAGQKRAD